MVTIQMSDFVAASDNVSPLIAVLWVFYPMTALVLIELLLRAFNNDDDDDDQGGGVLTPVYQGAES